MFNYEKHRDGCGNVVHRTDKNLNFAMHYHDGYEFIFCYDGILNVTITDRIYRVRQGKCILIAPGQAHSYYTADYSKTYMCVFPSDCIAEFFNDHQSVEARYPVFSMPAGESFCRKMQAESDKYAFKALAYQIASAYAGHGAFEPYDEKKYQLLHSIIGYVDSRCTEDISLKSMAKALGYSYNYLSALFNDALDRGFAETVNMYRISRAENLLLNTELPVAEIAAKCGYTSQRSFSRNYHRFAGKTPTETRLYRTDNKLNVF